MATAPEPKPFLARTWDYITETQIWKSIFRHGMPNTSRNRVLVVMTNVFLHLHPVKIRKSGIRLKFTWCMGGLTFFLFLVETFTGLLLMFYYRPTVAYAYMDIVDLARAGAARASCARSTAGALTPWSSRVWLHMFRVFMTGSYKPPREFNWNVGVILLVLTLLPRSPATCCPGTSWRSGPSPSARTWRARRRYSGTKGQVPSCSSWVT